MRTLIEHSLIVLGFAVIAAAWPVAAQLPSECQDLAPSADPPPADLMDYCRQFVQPQEGIPMRRPTDMADGVDGNLFACVSLTLNAPDVVTSVGSIGEPGNPPDFRPACDFANNDFTKLYCYDNAVPGNLSSVDPSTCAETFIGTASNTSTFFNGMAWDASTGTMFVVNTDELFTVDLATGASTLVGPITNLTGFLLAIGVDPSGDLFGYGTADTLLKIDKTTAAGTVVGSLGFDAEFAQGMDFDHSDDTCYLFSFNFNTFQAELRTCNTSTGATTLIGAIGSTIPGGQQDWTAAGIRTPDGMTFVFEDGFESGDTLAWSSTVP